MKEPQRFRRWNNRQGGQITELPQDEKGKLREEIEETVLEESWNREMAWTGDVLELPIPNHSCLVVSSGQQYEVLL